MNFSDEVKSFLEAASFAVVCVRVEVEGLAEAVLLVKSAQDAIEGLRAAGAGVRVGFVVERTAAGPVVCLVFRAEREGTGELVGETYFDPADPADGELFALLASQQVLRVGFLDENLEMLWAAELPWDELRRLEAAQAWDRAEEWLEGTEAYDFEAAKELFQASLGLDGLLERAFP